MQLESAAAKFSKSSLVWTALRATRSRHELGDTVGGLIASTWKPACSKCRLACSALSLLAYPAIGVRQDPSKVVRKALSQEIASLVSS